jgi:hypothetical protein
MQRDYSPTPSAQDSYELLGRRIQRLVASPGVQKIQSVTVSRLENESPEAWERVIREIEETNGVRLDRIAPDVVRIGWREYMDN